MGKKLIEIMDTTLRDGEQTSGVSYTPNEKLTIAKLTISKLIQLLNNNLLLNNNILINNKIIK